VANPFQALLENPINDLGYSRSDYFNFTANEIETDFCGVLFELEPGAIFGFKGLCCQ
jgi:hypothetical protein